MRKIIVTGFSGFVARHYLDYLHENESGTSVLGLDVVEPRFSLDDYNDRLDITFQTLNLMDDEAVRQVIADYQPTEILHLAAFSSVGYSWQHPADCFSNNTKVFLSVVEAVRVLELKCRILSVGSSEIYGDVQVEDLPLREDRLVQPLNPYAIARQSQEQLAHLYAKHFGVEVILTRSFNHIGPRQDTRFVAPSFVERILNVKRAGATSGVIETGDTTVVRDFLDVRDVVRAYDMLLKGGHPGEVYNICSGHGMTLDELIALIGDVVGVSVTNTVNPEFVRPDDNREIVGSNDKIHSHIGWLPQIPLRQTITDMVEYMETNN